MIAMPRRAGLPTSAVRELAGAARRTLVLRIGLAVVALALLVAAVAASGRLGARPTSYFASGGGGVVVLDLSTSVEPRKYQRIQRVLDSLAESSAHIGLVVFSDTGYEMFPPGTRGDEIRPLLRFFQQPEVPIQIPQPRFQRDRRDAPRSFGPASPWDGTFRGGTRISTGLREARRVIERDGIRSNVLLVSDLDNSGFDMASLTQELIRYEQEAIDLRVVPLFAPPEDRDLFERLVGERAFVPHTELLRNSELEERQALVGTFPLALVLAALVLLALLAVNERYCGRVAWRRA
jgi:hypothetical protein